jgi:hypothetical protein
MYTSQKITLNDLFIEYLNIQTFNGLPIHLIENLHEKETKKKILKHGLHVSKPKEFGDAHRDKHLKRLDMLMPKKNI